MRNLLLLKFIFVFCTLGVVQVDAQLPTAVRTVQSAVQAFNASARVTPAMQAAIANSGAVRQIVQMTTIPLAMNAEVMGLIQAYQNAHTLENVQAILTHPAVQQIAQQRLEMEYKALNLAFDRMVQAVDNSEVTINEDLIARVLSSDVIQDPVHYIARHGRTATPGVQVQQTRANMRVLNAQADRQTQVTANKEAARQLILDVKNALHNRANALGPTTELAQELRTLANTLSDQLNYLLDQRNIAILTTGTLAAIQNWGDDHISAIRNLLKLALSVSADNTARVGTGVQHIQNELQMMFPTNATERYQEITSPECNLLRVRRMQQAPDAA